MKETKDTQYRDKLNQRWARNEINQKFAEKIVPSLPTGIAAIVSVVSFWGIQALFSLVPFFQNLIMYLNPAGLYAMLLPNHFAYLSGLYPEDALGLQMSCLAREMTILLSILTFILMGKGFRKRFMELAKQYDGHLETKKCFFSVLVILLGCFWGLNHTFVEAYGKFSHIEGGGISNVENFRLRVDVSMLAYFCLLAMSYMVWTFIFIVISKSKKKENNS